MQLQIDYPQLKARCQQTEWEDFLQIPNAVHYDVGVNHSKRLIFIDNGAPVLAIAHFDTVIKATRTNHFFRQKIEDKTHVFSAQLDDRVGMYAILDLLPKLLGEGRYDILITDDEEISQSTAQFFKPEQFGVTRTYNWMFQFDRRGDDTVMYQYETPVYRKMLEGFGFKVATGQASDISKLGHLGCTGFNFGCGYQQAHSVYDHMLVHQFASQVKKFCDFFNDKVFEAMPYVPKTYNTYQGTGGYYQNGQYRNNGGSWKKDEDNYKSGDWKKNTSQVPPQTPALPSSIIPAPEGTQAKKPLTKPGQSKFKHLYPKDLGWITDTKMCQISTMTKPDGMPTKVYRWMGNVVPHPEAVQCSICEQFHWREEVVWEKAPICFNCNANLIDFDTDQIRWIQEGGVLIKISSSGGWAKDIPQDMKEYTVDCEWCGELEWQDVTHDVTIASSRQDGVTKAVVCRSCFGHFSNGSIDGVMR